MIGAARLGGARRGGARRALTLYLVVPACCGVTIGIAVATSSVQAQPLTQDPTPVAVTGSASARHPLPPTQGNLGHPYSLPQASRARIHACSVEWQEMKLSGAAKDEVWRVFASTCLAAPGETTAAPGKDRDR